MRLSTPFLQKNSQRRPFPHRGKFFEKFFRGRFSGEFFCKISVFSQANRQTIHSRQQTQSPAIMPPASPPGLYTHTRPHEQPHMTNGTGSRPGQRSTRHQLHQAAGTVPPIRAGKSREFSQVAADHAGQAGPEAIRTHAHTPAGQRNASPGTQAAHTPTPSNSSQAPGRTGNTYPHPPQGQQANTNTRQNPNARTQALRKRGIFRTPRTHARINSPAPAREKVLRARLRPLRVATPKIFVGLGSKNHFPRPWAAY